eukprot:g16979.t1
MSRETSLGRAAKRARLAPAITSSQEKESLPAAAPPADASSHEQDSLEEESPLALVRRSCWELAEVAQSVHIDHAALQAELTQHTALYSRAALPPNWAQSYHFQHAERPDLTAQYVLVLDALNFCFWPLEGYEYAELAGSLKSVLEKDPTAFDAKHLANMSSEELSSWLQPPAGSALAKKRWAAKKQGAYTIPLVAERARALREVGRALLRRFEGHASQLVREAKCSAVELVRLVTAHLPAFRDHCVFEGRQRFFYKRAQILVGDLWGAFGGRGLGHFTDLEQLTCFADYRVPQLLRHLQILRYSDELARRVDAREEMPAGSLEELEVRACTVHAVELLCAEQRKLFPENFLHPFQLDWLLWERGEKLLAEMRPHHRVLTIYY